MRSLSLLLLTLFFLISCNSETSKQQADYQKMKEMRSKTPSAAVKERHNPGYRPNDEPTDERRRR